MKNLSYNSIVSYDILHDQLLVALVWTCSQSSISFLELQDNFVWRKRLFCWFRILHCVCKNKKTITIIVITTTNLMQVFLCKHYSRWSCNNPPKIVTIIWKWAMGQHLATMINNLTSQWLHIPSPFDWFNKNSNVHANNIKKKLVNERDKL